MEEWTRPNYDWRRTSNPITTGGSPTLHRVVRLPSFLWRWLSWNNLCTSPDRMLETPEQSIPDNTSKGRCKQFLPLYVLTCSNTQVIKVRTSNRCTIRDWYNHSELKCIHCSITMQSNVYSLLMPQRSNTNVALRIFSTSFLCLCHLWHWERDLETSQKQKLNLSISVCASWRQCMTKQLEKSGIKSFSRQQETITFQVPLASRITRLIWHLQSEIDAESFRSGVQEAVSCPGTITAYSNRKAARLWGAKMTSASAIK